MPYKDKKKLYEAQKRYRKRQRDKLEEAQQVLNHIRRAPVDYNTLAERTVKNLIERAKELAKKNKELLAEIEEYEQLLKVKKIDKETP